MTAQSEKARDDDYPDILPEDSRTDFALEAAAAAVSILPGLGGAIANLLTGWSAERKRERVREVLGGLALRLAIDMCVINDHCLNNVLSQTQKGKAECRKKLLSSSGWRARRRRSRHTLTWMSSVVSGAKFASRPYFR